MGRRAAGLLDADLPSYGAKDELISEDGHNPIASSPFIAFSYPDSPTPANIVDSCASSKLKKLETGDLKHSAMQCRIRKFRTPHFLHAFLWREGFSPVGWCTWKR